MNLGPNWTERTLQQLVRYEALFKLLDEIQLSEDVGELAQPIARQWKYFANVASWRLVVANGGSFKVIDGRRGEARVADADDLSPWDAHHWTLQRPCQVRIGGPLEGPPPPEHLVAKGVSEIMILPFSRMGGLIGLLSAAARHEPFSDLDTKFIRIFGGHFADRVSDILFRARATQTLLNKAEHDALTGLLNRGAIMEQLQRLLAAACRTGEPMSVILCDIDHFKGINDTYGHLVGDKVLREVASRLKAQVRNGDGLGRYGGEEFLAALYPCTAAEAAKAAERFRRAIEELPFSLGTEGASDLTVTISLGTASIPTGSNIGTESLLKWADGALYSAKANGRNRVVSAEGPLGP